MINGAIVLLQDAVSIGGYVTLGTVIQCDQDLLAHNKPGDKIRFVPVTQEQALHARKERYELLNRIRESCLRF
jgi:allophanate hydrolase subunit 2